MRTLVAGCRAQRYAGTGAGTSRVDRTTCSSVGKGAGVDKPARRSSCPSSLLKRVHTEKMSLSCDQRLAYENTCNYF